MIYGYKCSFSQFPQNFFQPLINLIVGKLYGINNLGYLTQSLYIFNAFYKLLAVFTDKFCTLFFQNSKKIR